MKVWNGPVRDGKGAPPGISRLAYRIYRTRTDVQSAMPDIFGGHYRRFLEWVLVKGKLEHGLGEVFLTTISDAMRTCKEHRDALAWPDIPEQDAFSNELVGGSAEPANGGPRLRLTRLAAAIYQSRPELQHYFPDPCGRDSVRFLAWLLTYGRKEHNLSRQNTDPMKEQWRSMVRSLPGWWSRVRHELILRGMAASVSVRSVLARWPILRSKLRRARAEPEADRSVAPGKRVADTPVLPQEYGVNLIGYFQSESGVGQSARATYAALRAATVPASIRGLRDFGPGRQRDHTLGAMSAEFPYAANLFHVNADQTLT